MRKSNNRKIKGKEYLLERIRREVPQKSGIYQFINQAGTVIYIGKSVNLKNRLQSHFNALPDYEETRSRMIHEIVDFSFEVLRTELEALLREDELIKRYLPHYNTRQKEMDENVAVVFSEHRYSYIGYQSFHTDQDGPSIFGPFKDKYFAEKLIYLIAQEFGIRTCRGELPDSSCSLLGINQCSGPCVNMVSATQYSGRLNSAEQFLRGENRELPLTLKRQMKELAAAHKFEKAQQVKEELDFVNRFQDRQRFLNRFSTDRLILCDTDAAQITFLFDHGNYRVVESDNYLTGKTGFTDFPQNSFNNPQFITDRGNIVFNYLNKKKNGARIRWISA